MSDGDSYYILCRQFADKIKEYKEFVGDTDARDKIHDEITILSKQMSEIEKSAGVFHGHVNYKPSITLKELKELSAKVDKEADDFLAFSAQVVESANAFIKMADVAEQFYEPSNNNPL